jgi:hypothetical protein
VTGAYLFWALTIGFWIGVGLFIAWAIKYEEKVNDDD